MKRFFAPLLLILALLCGCAAKEAGENPLPTPSPEGLAERLAAAEGQELDLWAYDVGMEDLAQCANFVEGTGFRTLSAPPENVTKYSRRYAGGYCYESFHQAPPEDGQGEVNDWVLITDAGAGDGFCQELPVPGDEGMGSISGELDMKDIDLDGHDDAELFYHGGSHGVREFTAILWDVSSESYRVEESYRRISKPIIDKEHKLYWGGYSGAVYESRSAFEYMDGEFVETHRLYIERNDYEDLKSSPSPRAGPMKRSSTA